MAYVDPALQPDTRPSSLKWSIALVVVLFVLAVIAMVALLFLQTTSDQLKQNETSEATNMKVVSEVSINDVLLPQVIEQRRTGYNEYAYQQAVTAQYYPEPPVPENVEVRNTAIGNSVMLTWTVPEQQVVDAVEIYRTSQENTAPTLVDTVEAPIHSYIDDSVQMDQQYWYSLRAISTIDARTYSSKDTSATHIIVEDSISPAPPQIDSITTTADDPLVIEVTWLMNDLSDTQQFRVYRSQTSGQLGTVVAEVDATVNQLQDPTVEPGVTYYYTVTAVDQSGNESSTRFQRSAPGNSQPFILIP